MFILQFIPFVHKGTVIHNGVLYYPIILQDVRGVYYCHVPVMVIFFSSFEAYETYVVPGWTPKEIGIIILSASILIFVVPVCTGQVFRVDGRRYCLVSVQESEGSILLKKLDCRIAVA